MKQTTLRIQRKSRVQNYFILVLRQFLLIKGVYRSN